MRIIELPSKHKRHHRRCARARCFGKAQQLDLRRMRGDYYAYVKAMREQGTKFTRHELKYATPRTWRGVYDYEYNLKGMGE